MDSPTTPACPFDPARDDRKSAAMAEAMATAPQGETVLTRFAALREVFRSTEAVQGMAGGDAFITGGNPDHTPVFFLDGEPHRKRRSAIARYFTPKAITSRYQAVMDRTSDAVMADLRRTGSAVLDEIAFRMAVDVTAEVVGLTDSDSGRQARRLRTMLDSEITSRPPGLSRTIAMLVFALRMQNFWFRDVRPAVRARRKAPREDVISHMIRENYSTRAMLIECLIYGTAGMVTTRELITMAAWHMLEDDALLRRFQDGGEDDQFAIIEEILRLEPVAGMLYRVVPDTAGGDSGRLSLDVRAANLDPAEVGPCPHALDPDRAKRMRTSGHYMSFGDGPHRCPGAQLALHETRVFLDKLLRLPGISLARAPRVAWNDAIMGYELRDGVVACDRAVRP